MYKDTFRNFIEINGLSIKILHHKQTISSENKRISDLEAKRAKAQTDIIEFEKELNLLNIKGLEQKIEMAETNLAKFRSQVTMVHNAKELLAINHEIAHVELLLKNLEVSYFESEEKVENIVQNINNNKDFLKGSFDTLAEITAEVSIQIEHENKEINNYQNRINALLEQLPLNAKNLFLDVDKKFKGINPCAFINHRTCSQCRIAIDASTVNNVDRMVALEQCPNCGRILLPVYTNLS